MNPFFFSTVVCRNSGKYDRLLTDSVVIAQCGDTLTQVPRDKISASDLTILAATTTRSEYFSIKLSGRSYRHYTNYKLDGLCI